MIPTITKFTNAILEHYPNTTQITLYVNEPRESLKFDAWEAAIASIRLHQNDSKNESFKLTPVGYYKMFNSRHAMINLGKNNKNRVISRDNTYRITIDTKLNTFTTKQGQTISYYPTETTLITDDDVIERVINAADNFDVGMFESYRMY